MKTLKDALDRPLPKFEDWLASRGRDERAPGYEGFQPFVDLVRRENVRELTGLSDDELSFLRLWTGLAVAAVECCEIERAAGRSVDQIWSMLPRAMGVAALNAAASPLSEDAPFRRLATVLVEEFRYGAELAANTLEAADERGR